MGITSFRVIEHIAETQKEIFEYAISNGYFMDDFIISEDKKGAKLQNLVQ